MATSRKSEDHAYQRFADVLGQAWAPKAAEMPARPAADAARGSREAVCESGDMAEQEERAKNERAESERTKDLPRR